MLISQWTNCTTCDAAIFLRAESGKSGSSEKIQEYRDDPTLASRFSYKGIRRATGGFAHYTQNAHTHHHGTPVPAREGRIYCPAALQLKGEAEEK